MSALSERLFLAGLRTPNLREPSKKPDSSTLSWSGGL